MALVIRYILDHVSGDNEISDALTYRGWSTLEKAMNDTDQWLVDHFSPNDGDIFELERHSVQVWSEEWAVYIAYDLRYWKPLAKGGWDMTDYTLAFIWVQDETATEEAAHKFITEDNWKLIQEWG